MVEPRASLETPTQAAAQPGTLLLRVPLLVPNGALDGDGADAIAQAMFGEVERVIADRGGRFVPELGRWWIHLGLVELGPASAPLRVQPERIPATAPPGASTAAPEPKAPPIRAKKTPPVAATLAELLWQACGEAFSGWNRGLARWLVRLVIASVLIVAGSIGASLLLAVLPSTLSTAMERAAPQVEQALKRAAQQFGAPAPQPRPEGK